MFRRFVTVIGLSALASSTVWADFSYQERSTITGGSMLSMLKMAGVFSKNARAAGEPTVSTVAVKGDRMVHRGDLHMSLIDLGAQTITSVDMQKKTYTVMTFDEMKQAMEQTAQRMHQQDPNDPQMEIKVSANATGNTKPFAGVDAREMLIKIEMQATDAKSGQSGSIPITIDTWIAPAAQGYQEVREFYKRMAEKIGWTPGGNMFMSRPDVAKGMAEAYKQVSQLDGMAVFETVTMGAAGDSGAGGQPAAQQQDQPQQQQQKPSLGGLLGRGIGVNRSKSSSSQPSQSSTNSNPGSLLEMTMEMSGFSSNPVDGGQFAVPSGFKQVQPDRRRMQ